MKWLAFLLEFLREEEGQDLIEYALLAALVCVVALTAAGSRVNGIFDANQQQLAAAGGN